MAAVFVAAFVARALVILRLTPMPSGDGYDRLAHTDRLVVHDWLPLYQALLDALALVSRSPLWLRGANAAVGGLAAAAFALLVTAEYGAAAGLAAGLAVAVSPVHGLAATGLYQEPLFVLLVCGALAALRRRPGLAVGLVALASLTRYEGWILAGVVAAGLSRRAGSRWQALALALAPASWILWRAQAGGEALGGWLDVSFAPSRAVETARLLRGLLAYWVGWPAVAAAAVGAALLLRDASRGRFPGPGPTALLLLGAADLAFVTVARPYSPPDNMRQLHLVVLVLALLAARVVAAAPRGVWAAALLVAGFGVPSLRGWSDGAPDPLVRRAHAAASVLPPMAPDAAVLVLDPGDERYPGGIPSGCATVLAYAELAPARVFCDADAPSEAAALPAWMLDHNVGTVVWPDPSAAALPVHHAVRAAWEAGELELVAWAPFDLPTGARARRPDDPVVLRLRP